MGLDTYFYKCDDKINIKNLFTWDDDDVYEFDLKDELEQLSYYRKNYNLTNIILKYGELLYEDIIVRLNNDSLTKVLNEYTSVASNDVQFSDTEIDLKQLVEISKTCDILVRTSY